MLNVFSKAGARANHILNVAIATQLNKEILPTLFNTERLSDFDLNSCWFGCEVWKQLNSGRLNNAYNFK